MQTIYSLNPEPASTTEGSSSNFYAYAGFTRTAEDIANPVTVYFTVGGTAAYGIDYVFECSSSPATVVTAVSAVIAANANAVQFTIRALTDAVLEGTETVIITLAASLTNSYQISNPEPRARTYSLLDVAPILIGVVLKDADPISATEPVSSRHFRIQSFNPANLTATLAVSANTTVYYTMSGTATSGTDYTALSGSAVIASNSHYVDVLLTVIDDAIVENNETAIMTINPINAAYTVNSLYPSATMHITDNDEGQVDQVVGINFNNSLTFEDPNAVINSPGYNNIIFLFVSITRPTTANLVVNFTLTGTAVRGVDYELFEDPNKCYQTGYLPLPTTVYTGATTFTFTPLGAPIGDFIIKVLNDSVHKGYRSIIATLDYSSLYSLRTLNSYPTNSYALANSIIINRPEDLLWISEDDIEFVRPTLPTDPADPDSPDYPVLIWQEYTNLTPSTSTSPTDQVDKTVVETENEFIEVSSIIKTEPSKCDITIEDADGVILARIANNELSSVYQIIDVSELPWSTASGSTFDHYVEILYKKALPNFVNDGDEFPAIGYDDIVVNKMMQIFAEEQGNGKSAMAYDMKASRSLARMAEEENRATVDCVGFVSNAHDGLLCRVGSLLRLR